MNTAEYMAFMESQLATDDTLSFDERVAIQEDLIEYYACLAELEEKLQDETLSQDEIENAWAEYQELVLA